MRLFLLLLFGVVLLSAATAKPVPLRARMLWQPQAEFAGFYVALADGFYAEAGLDVTIDHAIPDEDIFEALQIGVADIVVAWPYGAIERAAKGGDIVNIGQIAQSSALVFIARKDRKINTPEELDGRKIGFWAPPALRVPFLAYLQKNGVHRFEPVTISSSINLFLNGGIDITPGLFYNEYYRVFSMGIDREEIVAFPLRQTFPHLVDDGLYAKQSAYRATPETYRKFHAATMHGWRRAFRNPERTLKIVLEVCRRNQAPVNIAHQRWMLKNMYPLIFPNGAAHHRRLRPESFDTVRDMLGITPDKIDYTAFAPAEPSREGGR